MNSASAPIISNPANSSHQYYSMGLKNHAIYTFLKLIIVTMYRWIPCLQVWCKELVRLCSFVTFMGDSVIDSITDSSTTTTIITCSVCRDWFRWKVKEWWWRRSVKSWQRSDGEDKNNSVRRQRKKEGIPVKNLSSSSSLSLLMVCAAFSLLCKWISIRFAPGHFSITPGPHRTT